MSRTAIAALSISTALGAALPAAAQDAVPRAVTVARATEIPRCTAFVDAAARAGGDGTVAKPHKTIAAAVAAAQNGAVICVAEGTYAEQLKPETKYFTLAGGFQSGKDFKVRDSARYASKARGNGAGSFFFVDNEGPKDNQLTAIDGFDISGYSQAIVRSVYYSQRFNITNNFIHDNRCRDQKLAGAGFSLANVSGRIEGNVIRNNSCGRGGAGALVDGKNENSVSVLRNHIDRNAGTEPEGSHGGALYLFGKILTINGNLFTGNSVTKWGAALYIGANTEGGETTAARLNWNIYRDNRAGLAGGGLFCDDGASCTSFHEIYVRNCGGNIYLDSGSKSGPTSARFDHLTNVGGLEVDCKTPGNGVQIDNIGAAPDAYSFVNALFWGNGKGRDFVVGCSDEGAGPCRALKASISHSMVQTEYQKNGATMTFGPGIVAPVDPLFADPEKGDFHLKSTAGRWTPSGHVKDGASSPAVGKGTGTATELGAYGNSPEASRAP
jgi:hypothetical protein